MRAIDHTHSPTPEDIMEYLDGEGTAASRSEIAAHLATCAACQDVAAEQRGISEHARAWSVPPSPASMHAPASPGGRFSAIRAWRRPPRWMLVALPAAAAVIFIVSIDQGRRDASSGKAVDMLRQSAKPAAAISEAVSEARLPEPPSQAGGVAGGPEQSRQAFAGNAAQVIQRAPAVIRTALLRLVVKDFAVARAAVDALVTQTDGFVDHMTVTGDTSEARVLRGTLRVPSNRMAETLTRLRAMGQVTEDTQGSQDVTDELVDLDARLATARATEQRLTELLRNRTGRLSDVLEVERELTRVRLDIERLDAQKANLGRRVSYASIDLTISEERKASLDGPLSLATRLRIAAADGLEAVLETVTALMLLALRAGPTLLFWGGIVALGWLTIRRRIRFGMQDPGLGIRDPR